MSKKRDVKAATAALLDTEPRSPEEDEAAQRAKKCSEELVKLLGQHRCRIIPTIIKVEQVGDGRQSLLTSSFMVVPEE